MKSSKSWWVGFWSYIKRMHFERKETLKIHRTLLHTVVLGILAPREEEGAIHRARPQQLPLRDVKGKKEEELCKKSTLLAFVFHTPPRSSFKMTFWQDYFFILCLHILTFCSWASLGPTNKPRPRMPLLPRLTCSTLPAGEDGAGSPGVHTHDGLKGVESQSTDDRHLG